MKEDNKKQKQDEYNVKYPKLSVIENFRDLGGYILSDGKVVKDDMIFRCGAVANLDDAGKLIFDELKIQSIFDFRGIDEISEVPDYVPSSCKYRNLPVISQNINSAVNKEQMMKMLSGEIDDKTIDEGLKMFVKLYQKFPFNNMAYKEMFKAMDTGEKFLFHCSAGKDRTGVASALILYALGADDELVKFDYLLSNYYRREVNERMLEKMKPMIKNQRVFEMLNIGISVNEKLIDESINSIKAKYGTIANFFVNEYGVDEKRIANWRKFYTV